MERQNLAWLILSMDTQASISSGWSSGLDDRDFNMVIPLGVASSPPSQVRCYTALFLVLLLYAVG
jgi:hypothetical protein